MQTEENQDVEVVIAPDDAETTTKDTKEPATKNVASEDELAALKAQLAAAAEREKAHNERALTAVREAANARSEQQRAVEAQFYAQDVAIANALTAAQAEAQGLEQDIERLAAEGKSGEMAQAVRKLARVEGRIADAERQKTYIDEQKAAFTQQQEIERQRQEQAARAPQPSARAASWIDAHPRFKTDAAYYNAAIGAHNLAQLRGIPVDSDEYFEFIETELGEREAPSAGSEGQSQRPHITVSAPPSRSTPTSQRQNERRLTLTPQEREMADITMSHIKEPAERYKRYALNKQRMLAENPIQ